MSLSLELFSWVFNDFEVFKTIKASETLGLCRQKRSAVKHLKISRCICSKKYVWDILKYLRHILNYLPCIFNFLREVFYRAKKIFFFVQATFFGMLRRTANVGRASACRREYGGKRPDNPHESSRKRNFYCMTLKWIVIFAYHRRFGCLPAGIQFIRTWERYFPLFCAQRFCVHGRAFSANRKSQSTYG